MRKIIFALMLITFIAPAYAGDSIKPFYAFYPSTKGQEFKKFEHNILGFSIDIPNDWTFGINGTGATTVAMLYPEKLDTSILTDSYENIEIGTLPFTDITLSQAYDFIILGMTQGHPNLIIEETVIEEKINGYDSLKFLYSWESKNGSVIKELIYLVSFKNQIRSITARYGQKKADEKPKYQSIIETFQPRDFIN